MGSQKTASTRHRKIGQSKNRKKYTNPNGKTSRVSPAIVEKYLAGIHFPAEKKLIGTAEKNDAPDDVSNLIDKLPEKIYTSPIDITKEIGKIQ
jgi:hypothetical protein